MEFYHVTASAKYGGGRCLRTRNFSGDDNKIYPLTVYSKEDTGIASSDYDPLTKVIHPFLRQQEFDAELPRGRRSRRDLP